MGVLAKKGISTNTKKRVGERISNKEAKEKGREQRGGTKRSKTTKQHALTPRIEEVVARNQPKKGKKNF